MANHHSASMELLTERQQVVYEFIRDKIRDRGYGPTCGKSATISASARPTA